MNKILIAAIAALCVIAAPADASNKPKRYHGGTHINGNHNRYNGGHNRYNGGHNHNNNNRYYRYNENNYYNYNNNNNNFYNNPYFWGGVAGGLIGGAIINGIDDEPYCHEVVTRVYVEGVGYRQGTSVVCE